MNKLNEKEIIETMKALADEWFNHHEYHNSDDDIILHEDVICDTMNKYNIQDCDEDYITELFNKQVLGWED